MEELEKIIYEEVHDTKIPCPECSMTEEYEVVDCQRVHHVMTARQHDDDQEDVSP